MTQYFIIGAGAFGLHTALSLREYDNNATITVFDKDQKNAASFNGGNGIIYNPSPYLTDCLRLNNLVSFDERNMYSKNIFFKEINSTWALIFGLNYFFNNKYNHEIIKSLDSRSNIKCKNSDVYDNLHWEQLTRLCLVHKIDIRNNTEVLSYQHIDVNTVKIKTNTGYLTCNKLIICTATNINLIKHYPSIDLIQCISGLSIIIKIEEKLPDCFYYTNGLFIAPFFDSQIKVLCHLEIGYDKGNYIIDEENPEYLKVIEFIYSQAEIQKYNPVSVIKIWRGTRAVTYDTLPFFTAIENNVYWFTGGSFSGCRVAPIFSKYFVNFISGKEYFSLPKIIDPTINRLLTLRLIYLFIISVIVFLIIRKVIIYIIDNCINCGITP